MPREKGRCCLLELPDGFIPISYASYHRQRGPAGRVGSGQDVFIHHGSGRVSSGHVGSGHRCWIPGSALRKGVKYVVGVKPGDVYVT